MNLQVLSIDCMGSQKNLLLVYVFDLSVICPINIKENEGTNLLPMQGHNISYVLLLRINKSADFFISIVNQCFFILW